MTGEPEAAKNQAIYRTETRAEMRRVLLLWFAQEARDFPWRRSNAWGRYVSEMMLQQTQTATVVPYFTAFMKRFPSPKDLAEAEEDQVLKAWEGLGYYRRARYLHQAAKRMLEFHAAQVPRDYDALRELPGIGDYAAGALASFLDNARTPAIDANVRRVMQRVLGAEPPSLRRSDEPRLREALKLLLESEDPEIEIDAAGINEALIELGALICRAGSAALCGRCPWSEFCYTYAHDLFDSVPQCRNGRTKPVTQWTIPILWTESEVLVRQRPDGGMLGGLYEFPMLEGIHDAASLNGRFAEYCELKHSEYLRPIKHVFSHRIWEMTFLSGRCASIDIGKAARILRHKASELEPTAFGDLEQLPMPAFLFAIRKDLSERSRRCMW